MLLLLNQQHAFFLGGKQPRWLDLFFVMYFIFLQGSDSKKYKEDENAFEKGIKQKTSVAYIFSPRHVNVAYWWIYTVHDYRNTFLRLFLKNILFTFVWNTIFIMCWVNIWCKISPDKIILTHMFLYSVSHTVSPGFCLQILRFVTF